MVHPLFAITTDHSDVKAAMPQDSGSYHLDTLAGYCERISDSGH